MQDPRKTPAVTHVIKVIVREDPEEPGYVKIVVRPKQGVDDRPDPDGAYDRVIWKLRGDLDDGKIRIRPKNPKGKFIFSKIRPKGWAQQVEASEFSTSKRAGRYDIEIKGVLHAGTEDEQKFGAVIDPDIVIDRKNPANLAIVVRSLEGLGACLEGLERRLETVEQELARPRGSTD